MHMTNTEVACDVGIFISRALRYRTTVVHFPEQEKVLILKLSNNKSCSTISHIALRSVAQRMSFMSFTKSTVKDYHNQS